MRKRWKTSDIKFLQEMNDKKDEVIAMKLGTTISSVQNARMRFGIIKDRSVHGFQKGCIPHNKKTI